MFSHLTMLDMDKDINEFHAKYGTWSLVWDRFSCVIIFGPEFFSVPFPNMSQLF